MKTTQRNKELYICRPVNEILGVALGELELKTTEMGKQYGDAADAGSAHHENGPGEFWRQELMRAAGKFTELKQTYNVAKIYDPPSDNGSVKLGSRVAVIENLPGGERVESNYTIVSTTDIMVCARLRVTHHDSWISTETTRGAALLNRVVGDTDIIAKIPDGQVRMEITAIYPGDFTLKIDEKKE